MTKSSYMIFVVAEYSYLYIGVRWAAFWQVWGENEYSVLVDKPEKMKPLGRLRPKYENIIKRDLRSNGIERRYLD